MKKLTMTQMPNFTGGDWHEVAIAACGVWGFGRFFLGAAISCAASPLTGVICTKIVDGACAVVGVSSFF